MKSIKTSKLANMESIAEAITICPVTANRGYVIEMFLKEKTPTGKFKKKSFLVEKIIEDEILPEISVKTVEHLGYKTYQYIHKPSGFYINFYKI